MGMNWVGTSMAELVIQNGTSMAELVIQKVIRELNILESFMCYLLRKLRSHATQILSEEFNLFFSNSPEENFRVSPKLMNVVGAVENKKSSEGSHCPIPEKFKLNIKPKKKGSFFIYKKMILRFMV